MIFPLSRHENASRSRAPVAARCLQKGLRHERRGACEKAGCVQRAPTRGEQLWLAITSKQQQPSMSVGRAPDAVRGLRTGKIAGKRTHRPGGSLMKTEAKRSFAGDGATLPEESPMSTNLIR